ncbi:pyridoxal phosphate-dependent transferase [Collybia nuda]|uniref:Pyridoxal phosphate-dependent transferase n=1 Tax=Collybia nuda TaxID=64659 RepID=A0A9P5Y407_9AGAR|nr:pyridoxal phosphate-dependent transferase [Collybia nuda]
MITSQEFQDGVKATEEQLKFILEGLGRHSVPFFSPRYAGHMSFDVSMPAALGYASAMMYNQNNVTPEASPFTSYVEWRVGQEMCLMLGYNFTLKPDPNNPIVGWGHIVCGGSIADLESMWVARNLKYYPLSLKNAMKPGAPLEFASDTFTTTRSDGTPKNFFSCTPWELLNLKPGEVMELPVRLSAQFGISDTVLSRILEPYSIQTVGKQQLDLDFGITKPPQYLISRVNHYSWPKGAAITGIGRDNMIELPVDDDARLDIEYLREELEKHLAEEQALYAIVAIVGTTEHGSVDPVDKMLQLRDEMQTKGLSFMVHADAAWGGYFASKMVEPVFRGPQMPEYAFSIPLSSHTNSQMLRLRFVDSITIDPHKSGYIPYPGGGLCYRDGRYRFLTTWTSPYINVQEGNDLGMGIYGVEGSKPGAAPVAVWLSHNSLTYGVARVTRNAKLHVLQMYANWVTMTLDTQPLVVTAFNRLPSERSGSSEQEIYDECVRIRNTIVNRPNYELENDLEAMELVRQLGSDLMINAFACNFRIEDKINTDVVEASFLNRRLYQRLSITTMDEDINLKPIVIMATEFSQAKYGEVLNRFKKRMGLVGDEDLYALSNVSMSPWPAAGQFLQTIINEFRRVAEEEIKTCLVRVVVKLSIHSFVIQGTDQLFFTYVGSLNISNYRRQVIVSAKLDDATMSKL